MSVFFKPVQRPFIFLEIQSNARMKMKTAGGLLTASAPSDFLGTRKNSSKKQEETSVDRLMYLPSVRVKFYGVTIQMKPLHTGYHLFIYVVCGSNLWMKSFSVNFRIKPFEHSLRIQPCLSPHPVAGWATWIATWFSLHNIISHYFCYLCLDLCQ